MHNPIVLIILDGWGHRLETAHNAIAKARTAQWDAWLASSPHTLLACSGEAVGLPSGQMGNSEVGHMHMGAGRILNQDYTRINQSIEDGSFFHNEALLSIKKTILPAVTTCAFEDVATRDLGSVEDKDVRSDKSASCDRGQYSSGKAIHVLGLLSPGGVHSHENHLFALLRFFHENNIHSVYLHLFLDGRDTPPRSAKASLEKLEVVLKQYPCAEIKSICGRYFAMDRDSRWDRIACIDDVLTTGKGVFSADNVLQALENAYARGESDEFVQTTVIGKSVPLEDDDIVFFMNYRSDRARQLSRVLVSPNFSEFKRKRTPKLHALVTLTHYATDIPSVVLFPPLMPKQTLGECVSQAGLTQLRIAETEKYAHVTFFFNGGAETPFPKEDRLLIPSPRVATYDLQPEMSAVQIQEKMVEAILAHQYDLIIANFANADMVGHTGDLAAAIQAVECLDSCLKKINDACEKAHVDIIITSDHGNAECMFDEETHQKHTAHTSLPVPFLYINHHPENQVTIAHSKGSLIDIAPTVLYALNVPIPDEMTGKSLVCIQSVVLS